MQEAPEKRIHRVFTQTDRTLATAESCTGGLLGDRLTATPGSSAYYIGGIISYANEVKENLLGVSNETMIAHGAVSRETALEMARGVRKALQVDYGVSVTGIAGPGGGSPEKPVGLTWVAVSGPEGDRAEKFIYSGDRGHNKQAAADSALELLLEVVSGQLDDPILVETKSDQHNRLVPLAFTWEGERHQVRDWGRRWQEEDGEHMLIRTERDETFEIVLDQQTDSWRMVRKLRTPRGPAAVI